MTYFKTMARLLMLDIDALLDGSVSLKSLQLYCALNVAILGFIYGLFAGYLSSGVMAAQGMGDAEFSSVKIALAGIPVAFLMHAGAALFIWVFLRGIGGKTDFLTSYFFIGIAGISLWPLAPFAAAFQVIPSGGYPWIMAAGALLSILFAVVVNYMLLQRIYRLSQTKMALAASVTVIYIGCFLYLWV